jgi:hypothetical protein
MGHKKLFNSLHVFAVATSLSLAMSATPALAAGKWMAGDFHNHTFLTDGSNTQADVLSHAFQYGLDWMANSEHGGAFFRNPEGNPWPADTEFLGNPSAGNMWRWQSLWQYSYPIISAARTTYPDKLIIQAYEWNVPTHEHASVAIVGPGPEHEGKNIAQHEYVFDGSDQGTTSSNYLGVPYKIAANTHEKAVNGAKWLEYKYPFNSYFILNHPSRKLKYTIADIRDFNTAAPTVAIGLEGIPGHQKESDRGGYGSDFGELTYKAHTYGGADYMISQVGGLWDALLGEGRHFYTFTNSDFHATDGDFWPGEYAKSYTFVMDSNNDGNYTTPDVVKGLRSGNSFSVLGDLINALGFSATSQGEKVGMGKTLVTSTGSDVKITIQFQSPALNNNNAPVAVDHIDLIAGEVTGEVAKYLADGTTPNPAYSVDTNPTTNVLATFTSADWKEKNGWYTVSYTVPNVSSGMYFRLRGTNLAPNTPNETDSQGNPLIDDLMAPNTAEKAYADLWFYSNPIFVQVQ